MVKVANHESDKERECVCRPSTLTLKACPPVFVQRVPVSKSGKVGHSKRGWHIYIQRYT